MLMAVKSSLIVGVRVWRKSAHQTARPFFCVRVGVAVQGCFYHHSILKHLGCSHVLQGEVQLIPSQMGTPYRVASVSKFPEDISGRLDGGVYRMLDWLVHDDAPKKAFRSVCI